MNADERSEMARRILASLEWWGIATPSMTLLAAIVAKKQGEESAHVFIQHCGLGAKDLRGTTRDGVLRAKMSRLS